MSKITCCHNCADRKVSCHSICERYIVQRKERDVALQGMCEKEIDLYKRQMKYKIR